MKNFTSNSSLTPFARNLRKNMTKEEKKLWYGFLRDLSDRFHRQYVIDCYIVDFCCVSKRLIIELDGSQHYEDDAQQYDSERDAYLCKLGYQVLRYSNLEVLKNFRGICEDIMNHLEE